MVYPLKIYDQRDKNKRHRHENTSWLIANGNYQWCYQCGAIRKMKQMEKQITFIPYRTGANHKKKILTKMEKSFKNMTHENIKVSLPSDHQSGNTSR